MSKLQIGDPAPSFESIAVGGPYGDGTSVRLADFAGKNLVLYFYPKDDTPGCTTQACGLRDGWAEISEKAVIFGVSIDPAKSHLKFIEKYGLPFPLLSDENHALVESYQVWVEKNMYGKTSMGTERSTFVISPEGTIKAIFRKVKPDEHINILLEVLS
ncbi:MAG: thioredoxin-dependent thiol peroxidase [Verrucomicrobiota bacterium]